MADSIVGIDLGTSNSVVAVCDQGGNVKVLSDDSGFKVQPSVVSFHPNGSVVVGAEAKQRKVLDPKNTVYSAKRLIGRSFRAREVQTTIGRMPYVMLFQDAGTGNSLQTALGPVLDAQGIPYITSYETVPPHDATAFLKDGHFKPPRLQAFAKALHDDIEAALEK